MTILCARSLAKRDLFRLPDPFVKVTVDSYTGDNKGRRPLFWSMLTSTFKYDIAYLFKITLPKQIHPLWPNFVGNNFEK